MRRKRRKKQRKIIILSVISLLFIMCTGYAAFSTNLNITAKTYIIDNSFTITELKNKYCNTVSGDGLYIDKYEKNRCIYRGTNPDNYIKFNNELWRIVSIETDNNIKIVKQDSIGQLPYDNIDNRNNSNNTYCMNFFVSGKYYGCHIWGKIDGAITNTGTGTITQDASLNTYLNTNTPDSYYYRLSSKAKKQIISYTWNVGFIDYISTLENIIANEKTRIWNGKIAIISTSDFMKSSLDSSCTNRTSLCASKTPCRNNNYLFHETASSFYHL